MFRKDIRERRGGGVILYIKESIQAYEITLKSEDDCEEAIWCNIVTRNSTLTIGVVYRSPNIGQEEDVKLQKTIREVSKGGCVIMGDFNHSHIQWESLESAGGDYHQFLLLTQDCFLTQHVLEPTRDGNVLDLILSSQNELVNNVKVHEPLDNKTATECLKYEIEGIIAKCVPLRKHGKRSRKKHLSKETIRNFFHKQMLWRVYKHTENVEDYTNYNEALNLATTEIRKYKRTFEKKLAGNINNVKVHEPLGSSDHNQIHFNIKVKTGNTYKNNGGGTSTKANIKR